jgi:DNA topoisomerase-3
MVFFVGKTLVIAEKPSVGRDLAGALDGPFQRRKLEDIKPSRKRKQTNEEVVEAAKSPRSRARDEAVFLESDEYVITWAVGHLVQLAEPEEYDEKWKKWRMADLPIVPPDGARREVQEAAEAGGDLAQARRRRPCHQRL